MTKRYENVPGTIRESNPLVLPSPKMSSKGQNCTEVTGPIVK